MYTKPIADAGPLDGRFRCHKAEAGQQFGEGPASTLFESQTFEPD